MLKKFDTLQDKNILLALFSADLLFIILHILHTIPSEIFPYLRDGTFAITRDLGLAESFGYVEEFWIILVMVLLVFRFKKTPFISWGLLFIYIFLDDMLSIHESLGVRGSYLFENWSIIQNFENLRSVDLGELAISVILGIIFLSLIAVSYFRANRDIKKNFQILLILFATLALFGVCIDFLDRFVNGRILMEIFKLAEDGGEMLVISVICWYAYTLYENNRKVKAIDSEIG